MVSIHICLFAEQTVVVSENLNNTSGVQVREALKAAEPAFSSSRVLCNAEYCVAQDLPAVPGIDPKGMQGCLLLT
jgi:hypothetical protein